MTADTPTGTAAGTPAGDTDGTARRRRGRLRSAAAVAALAATALLLPGCGNKPPPPAAQPPCAGDTGVGSPVPAGARPGDVVRTQELTATDASGDASPGFPTGARVWRMLYVSSSESESDLTLVCGTVTLPTAGPTLATAAGATAGRTRVLTWTHGTQGLDQPCLPSSDPAKGIWGPMPAGIQTVAFGSLLGKHEGQPSGGMLQYAVDQGWIVATPDYQPNDTYVIGRIAAANAIDAVRAARQVSAQEFPATGDVGSDLVVAGHSQGGHAALWTGQLFDPYLAATGTEPGTIRLLGVLALAPAANFIVQPDRQPGTEFGDGLADREMHQSISIIPLPIEQLQLAVGPALFSYIFGSWASFSSSGSSSAGAATPAAPTTPPLQLDAVATAEGQDTISQVMPLCLSGAGATKIKQAVSQYYNAGRHQMLVPELWNLPPDYSEGEYFTGGVDRACATTPPGPLADWCSWIRWNIPGPLGDNPFPKVPTDRGRPVPVLMAQGTDDTVVHCVAPDGLPAAAVAPVADCTSTALFTSMESTYCPTSGAAGSLELVQFKPGPNSPASHLSIPGQLAARSPGKAASDLTFDGSRSQQFITSAFEGTTEPGCRSSVANP